MNQQKGISLIVTFLIMTIMLSMVLGLTTILFSQTKVINNASNSFSSFYSADSGVEKTYYLKETAGSFCNICAICTDCSDCTLTPLEIGGCELGTCNNCRLTYDSSFDDRSYRIDASLTPESDPGFSNICVKSEGFYKYTTRTFSLCNKIETNP